MKKLITEEYRGKPSKSYFECAQCSGHFDNQFFRFCPWCGTPVEETAEPETRHVS